MKHRVVCGIALTLALAVTPGANALDTGDYAFDVYLDDKKIGAHKYRIRRDEDRVLVESEAKFDVKFLFFTAYSYRHKVTERWDKGCLEEIIASTTTNGEKQDVSGEYASGTFAITRNGDEENYQECVMSFAYWNPAFLEQQKLLNPQTGEYLPVNVEAVEPSTAMTDLAGRVTEAWRVTAKDMDVVVLYASDRQWLGLESRLKGGRTLRYELS